MKSVNELFQGGERAGYFPKTSDPELAEVLEIKFLKALQEALTC